MGVEMVDKEIKFSETAQNEILSMREIILQMFITSKEAFEKNNKRKLKGLTALEEKVDIKKKELIANHFARLAEGNCNIDVSPYYSSVVVGLERVADHLVNVGYSIVSPTGSQQEKNKF